MTEHERELMQHLVSAAIRVVRTPMTDVPSTSPMARSVFALTLQLACMGFIGTEEAQMVGSNVSDESFREVLGEKRST